MDNQMMTVWGFWITIAGTVFGFASLVIAIYISVNTNSIRKNLTNKHLKEKYRKTKSSILLQLNTSYSLIKEFDRLDAVSIKEGIISLSIYVDILTPNTKKKLKLLRKKIDNNTTNDTKIGINNISEILFEVIQRLENELDEHTELVKEVTK